MTDRFPTISELQDRQKKALRIEFALRYCKGEPRLFREVIE